MTASPRRPWTFLLCVWLVGLALPSAVLAGNLTGVQANPSPANVNQTVTVTVTSGGSACGALIDFGDGTKSGRFVVNGSAARTHTYSQPGSLTVRGIGKPHAGKQACGATNSAGLEVDTTLVVKNASSSGPGVSLGRVPKGVREKIGKQTVNPGVLGKPVLPGKVTHQQVLKHSPELLAAMNLIEKVRIKPHGTWAEFEVLTKQPAAVTIEASTQPPNGFSFVKPDTAIFTLQYRISSKTNLQNLDPSKDYYFVVKARTQNDLISYDRGQFSTAGRHVRVTLSKVYVSDDGDSGPSGKGDFHFRVKALGTEHLKLSHDIGSGDWWHPNESFQLANVPSSLPIALGVSEEDGDFTSIQWYDESYGLETHGPGEDETWTRTLHAANGDYALTATFRFEVSYD